MYYYDMKSLDNGNDNKYSFVYYFVTGLLTSSIVFPTTIVQNKNKKKLPYTYLKM